MMRRKSSIGSFRGRERITWWLYFQGQTGYWSCSPASRNIEAESERLKTSWVNGVNSWNDQLDASCQFFSGGPGPSLLLLTQLRSRVIGGRLQAPSSRRFSFCTLKFGLWIYPEAQPKWERHQIFVHFCSCVKKNLLHNEESLLKKNVSVSQEKYQLLSCDCQMLQEDITKLDDTASDLLFLSLDNLLHSLFKATLWITSGARSPFRASTQPLCDTPLSPLW